MIYVTERQRHIEELLREEFRQEPGCRVVDEDGVYVVLFLTEEGRPIRHPLNLTKLAVDIERGLS
jgi:hypothetical protein